MGMVLDFTYHSWFPRYNFLESKEEGKYDSNSAKVTLRRKNRQLTTVRWSHFIHPVGLTYWVVHQIVRKDLLTSKLKLHFSLSSIY